MAQESSRTFDPPHGRVVVGITDSFGSESFHTIYVAGVADIEAEIAARIAETEEQAQTIRTRMEAAGWRG
jgi:hypothetical protein